MKNLVKMIAALLMVFSAATTHGSADSASLASYCKVMSAKKDKAYRIVYQSPETVNVEIKIKDENNITIYSERIKGTDGFVKNFDLSNVPDGKYTFRVESPMYDYKKTVKVSDNVVTGLHITNIERDKFALVGTNASEDDLTLYILDDAGNALFQEEIEKSTEVKQLFNLEKVEGKAASFVIYGNGKLVKSATVVL
jgi:hypothetical protein